MEERKSTPDAATRLWHEIEVVYVGGFLPARHQIGELFWKLRNLYSDRNSGGSRLTSGHGVFEKECIKRGYQPRRVREWINDHEVVLGLRKPAESTAAKRKARRLNSSAEYQRGYRAAMNDFPIASGQTTDAVSRFAALLPFEGLQSAYRTAAKLFHPDLGGACERMQLLNIAWGEAEKYFKSRGESVYEVATE